MVEVLEGLVRDSGCERSLNSWQCFALQQKLTFGKGAKNVMRGKR